MKQRRLKQLTAMLMVLLPLSAGAQSHQVLLETTEGNITLTLYDDTPIHSNNFLRLVSEHFYDSLLFHRVIPNFMIQGGDPNSRHAEPGIVLGDGDTPYTLQPEFFADSLQPSSLTPPCSTFNSSSPSSSSASSVSVAAMPCYR